MKDTLYFKIFSCQLILTLYSTTYVLVFIICFHIFIKTTKSIVQNKLVTQTRVSQQFSSVCRGGWNTPTNNLSTVALIMWMMVSVVIKRTQTTDTCSFEEIIYTSPHYMRQNCWYILLATGYISWNVKISLVQMMDSTVAARQGKNSFF